MRKRYTPVFLLLSALGLLVPASAQPVTIAVLGASTAAGKNLVEDGAALADSWVNRYAAYLAIQRPGSTIVNLAVAGYNTYHGMPTGSSVPAGRPAPDPAKNVTAAIAANPDVIIANYVGDGGFGSDEAMNNLIAIAGAAATAGIPIWITTPQPDIASTSAVIAQRQDLRDRILSQFGNLALNFWTPLADSSGSGWADRRLIQLYDDIHPNAEGHRLLFNQVVAAGVGLGGSAIFRPGKPHASSAFRVPGTRSLESLWKGSWRKVDGRISD